MDLESGTLLRLIITRALQVNDGLEHVLTLAGAARCNTAAAGMVDKQNGAVSPPELQQPRLHGVPDSASFSRPE